VSSHYIHFYEKRKGWQGSIFNFVIVKMDGNVFGKIRSDLEDLAFLRRLQGKPFGRSKCLSRRESEGEVR
jgi:hypothetical protein